MRRPSRARELARAMVVLLTCIVLAGFARPALAEIRIVALGDSGIYGQGVGRNETYPAKLERALKARGHDVSVANAGSNGDTTQGVLNRLDTAVPQGTQIVVLSVGVNDVVQFGIDAKTMFTTLGAIIRRLRQRGIEVLVFLPITLDKSALKGELADAPQAVQDAFSGAVKAGVLFTSSMQWKIRDDPKLHVEQVQKGTMWHLTPAGYDMIVARTLPLVEELIGRVKKR